MATDIDTDQDTVMGMEMYTDIDMVRDDMVRDHMVRDHMVRDHMVRDHMVRDHMVRDHMVRDKDMVKVMDKDMDIGMDARHGHEH
jgi:hypothetical protein